MTPVPGRDADLFLWFIAVLIGAVGLLSLSIGAYHGHHQSRRSVVSPPPAIYTSREVLS